MKKSQKTALSGLPNLKCPPKVLDHQLPKSDILCVVLCRKVNDTEATAVYWKLLHWKKSSTGNENLVGRFGALTNKQVIIANDVAYLRCNMNIKREVFIEGYGGVTCSAKSSDMEAILRLSTGALGT